MIDPKKKLEECERALETCTDVDRRGALHNLRYLWTAIDKDKTAGKSHWRDDAATVDKVHADVLGAPSARF
jgi:hypothetical protein